MGTRSKTTIFDENNKPLLAIYRQYDGYYDGHGEQLADMLSEIAIVNGYGSRTPAKAANGMGCLAAQIVAKLKEGIGNIYIVPVDAEGEEYNYEIRFVEVPGSDNNRVSLVGSSENASETFKRFKLYSSEIVGDKTLPKVEFVYDKRDGSRPDWRSVEVVDEDAEYIKGIEDGKYKNFLKSRIVGGRIIRL